MSSPQLQCSCTIVLREDVVLDVRELAEAKEAQNAAVEDCSLSPKRILEALRQALQTVRSIALAHRRHVHRVYRLKLDSIPPRLLGGRRIYTGQWVGVFDHYYAGGCLRLVIEPKYELFTDIYREVVEASENPVYAALILAVAGTHLGLPSALPSLGPAAWLLDEYARTHQPYIVVEEPLETPSAPWGLLSARRVVVNKRFYATLAAGASILARARSALQGSPGALAEAMGKAYTRLAMRFTSWLYSNPYIAEALQTNWLAEEEADEEQLALLRTMLLRSPELASRPTVATGLAALTPAPKIYEVYVLLKTLEALIAKAGRGVVERCDSIHCYRVSTPKARVKAYYNVPARRLSRIVYRIAGSRPHPDILLHYDGGARVVVEAKYRLGLALAGGGVRLRLREALRLLGYLADLASDSMLYAIVAVPVKEGDVEEVAESLDGIGVGVRLVEVNPDRGASELAGALP